MSLGHIVAVGDYDTVRFIDLIERKEILGVEIKSKRKIVKCLRYKSASESDHETILFVGMYASSSVSKVVLPSWTLVEKRNV